MAMIQKPQKPKTVAEQLEEIQQKMSDWSSLSEEVKNTPADVGLALMSGRPELLVAFRLRALSPAESQALVNLIRVLLDTNQQLQCHSALLAELIGQQEGQLRGIVRAMDTVRSYAHFRSPVEESED